MIFYKNFYDMEISLWSIINEEGSSKESENMSLFVWKIDEYIQAESGLGINVCKAFSGAIYVWWDNGCI